MGRLRVHGNSGEGPKDGDCPQVKFTGAGGILILKKGCILTLLHGTLFHGAKPRAGAYWEFWEGLKGLLFPVLVSVVSHSSTSSQARTQEEEKAAPGFR